MCTTRCWRIRGDGRAVLLISANLEELFLLADRIVVLHRGAIVADLPVEEASVEGVGALHARGKGCGHHEP